MYAQVPSESLALFESAGTFGAGVRSLSGMSSPMTRQIAAFRERFVALFTGIPSFAGVGPLVVS